MFTYTCLNDKEFRGLANTISKTIRNSPDIEEINRAIHKNCGVPDDKYISIDYGKTYNNIHQLFFECNGVMNTNLALLNILNEVLETKIATVIWEYVPEIISVMYTFFVKHDISVNMMCTLNIGNVEYILYEQYSSYYAPLAHVSTAHKNVYELLKYNEHVYRRDVATSNDIGTMHKYCKPTINRNVYSFSTAKYDEGVVAINNFYGKDGGFEITNEQVFKHIVCCFGITAARIKHQDSSCIVS